MFDKIFQGPPSAVAAGNSPQYAALGVDSIANALYVSTGNGWVPVNSASGVGNVASATAATQANVLTYAVPITGFYRVDTYAVQMTSTGGTLPSTAVAYTEGFTGVAESGLAVQATGTGTNAGDNKSGSVLIYAKAGTNIVVSSAAAATLTYSVIARVEHI